MFLRRKEIILTFKNVFGKYLLDKGFVFSKNCYVKYQNGVLRLIGVYSQKNYDNVEFDIILEMNSINEPFLNEMCLINADNYFSVGRIAKCYDEQESFWWYFDNNDTESLKQKMEEAFRCFVKYEKVYYEPAGVDEMYNMRDAYFKLLEDNSAPIPSKTLEYLVESDVRIEEFIKKGELDTEMISLLRGTVIDLRQELYCISDILFDQVDDANDTLNIKNVRNELKRIKKHKKILSAFTYGNYDYINRLLSVQEVLTKSIISENKRILKHFNLLDSNEF